MSTIIKGMLSRELPWGLVIIGIFISTVLELCGVKSLSFAVGAYLPLSTTSTIYAGGLVKAMVDKLSSQGEVGESELSSGMLYSTGLVAGGSLGGIAIAIFAGVKEGYLARMFNLGAKWHLEDVLGSGADLVALVAFILLALFLYRAARQDIGNKSSH
jgi:hypothetical protein